VIVDVGDDIPELKVDAADPVRKPSEPAKLVETKKRQPIDGKNLLREFLDNAQRKPRVVSDRSPPAQASRKQVVTKAAEPAKFGFYADLAKRESRLTNAEARKVAISPAFSEPLRALEQTILRDSEPRERVMIVSKDWATNLSDDFLSSCGHALITGLLLAALIIAGCPPLLVLAWVALFFLRRSKLKMELHSRDGEGQLTGRTEIGGLPRALCRACGTLSHLCPWALRRLDSRAQSGLQPAPHRRGRGLFLGGGSTAPYRLTRAAVHRERHGHGHGHWRPWPHRSPHHGSTDGGRALRRQLQPRRRPERRRRRHGSRRSRNGHSSAGSRTTLKKTGERPHFFRMHRPMPARTSCC
jgi:hypothetical protein